MGMTDGVLGGVKDGVKNGVMARDRGWVRCHDCGLIVKGGGVGFCPACDAALHSRKRHSVARTWALVLTGFIFLIPANIYPVMTLTHFGSGEPATIVEGVKLLIQGGLYGIATLVFVASFAVPLVKLLGLVYLLVSVQRGSKKWPRQRTLAYRIIRTIGRWSMLDIFMISILVALVQLQHVAQVIPGAGVTAFGLVVVVTMVAAECFDPRLIWDNLEANK